MTEAVGEAVITGGPPAEEGAPRLIEVEELVKLTGEVVVAGSKIAGGELIEVAFRAAIEGVATGIEAEETGEDADLIEVAVAGDEGVHQWLATKQWKHLFFTQIQRQRLLLQGQKSRPGSRRLA